MEQQKPKVLTVVRIEFDADMGQIVRLSDGSRLGGLQSASVQSGNKQPTGFQLIGVMVKENA